MKTDTFPKSLMGASTLLHNCQIPRNMAWAYGDEGIAFAQEGIDTETSRVQCYICENMGHCAREFPKKKTEKDKGEGEDATLQMVDGV